VRTWLIFAAKLIATLAILAFAIHSMDWDSLLLALKQFEPWVIVVVTLILIAEIPVLGLRWAIIAGPRVALPLGEHQRRYAVAASYNSFTPGQVGGDVYRFFAFREHFAETRGELVALLLQERMIGFVAYCAGFLIGLGLSWPILPAEHAAQTNTLFLLGAISLCFVLGAVLAPLFLALPVFRRLLSFSPRLTRLFDLLRLVFTFAGARQFLSIIALTVVGVAGWILALELLAWQMDLRVPIALMLLLGTATDLIRLVPITVQGIGLREGAFAWLFGAFGYPPEQGFVLGAIGYACVSLAILIAGVVGISLPKRA
jgi:uncharacterized membrane protein YbhN (UPF0104 family)